MGSEVIVLPILFVMVAFVVRVVVDGAQKRANLKQVTEMHSRLLDRIGSVKDFNEFLQTEGGVRFMRNLSVEPGSIGPRNRILGAMQTGIVLSCLGLGLLILSRLVGPNSDPHDLFMYGGGVVLSLGIGFAGSSFASYRLSNTLGLLNDNDGHSRDLG